MHISNIGFRLRHFYRKNNKQIKLAGKVFLVVIVVNVAFQLLYPSGRTLPLQKVGGLGMGNKSKDQVKQRLDTIQGDMHVTIEIADKKDSVKWQEIGIGLDQDEIIKHSTNYGFGQKLIPLSSLYRVFIMDSSLATKVDDAKLNEYAQKISTENSTNPANANITVDGIKVIRNDQKQGRKYETSKVAESIKKTPYKQNAVAKIQAENVQAAFSKDDVEATAKRAEAIIATEYKAETGKDTHVIPNSTVASWLQFKESADAKDIEIIIDNEKVKAFLNEKNKGVYKAPGQITVTMRDGVELQRTSDTSGQSLDIDGGAKAVAAKVLEAKPTTVKVGIVNLPPKINYQRTYTKSQAGMTALLNDIVADEKSMAISIRALDGSGIVASANGGRQYHPASTYKLSVALTAIKRIEAGSLQWTDDVNGRNVDQCVSAMIIVSDNPCASALGDKLGWQAVTNDSQAIGMGRTNLARGFVSATDDQALFMAKLQQGSLMNTANRDKLLGMLRQQKYRAGIPAGASGASVANKVGFINGLLHDSAIVYGSSGTYALAIYSDGSSWSRLAAATSKINALMNQ